MPGVIQSLLSETLYSPGGYSVIHTEVDKNHYTVCETVNDLPMSILKYFPHNCIKTVLQSLISLSGQSLLFWK